MGTSASKTPPPESTSAFGSTTMLSAAAAASCTGEGAAAAGNSNHTKWPCANCHAMVSGPICQGCQGRQVKIPVDYDEHYYYHQQQQQHYSSSSSASSSLSAAYDQSYPSSQQQQREPNTTTATTLGGFLNRKNQPLWLVERVTSPASVSTTTPRQTPTIEGQQQEVEQLLRQQPKAKTDDDSNINRKSAPPFLLLDPDHRSIATAEESDDELSDNDGGEVLIQERGTSFSARQQQHEFVVQDMDLIRPEDPVAAMLASVPSPIQPQQQQQQQQRQQQPKTASTSVHESSSQDGVSSRVGNFAANTATTATEHQPQQKRKAVADMTTIKKFKSDDDPLI